MVPYWYHIKKRETEKGYDEFRVICTDMSILIYNEEEIQ